MLELGVFCGKYLTDCRDEFPASWFARAKLSPSGRDCSLNYFGVDDKVMEDAILLDAGGKPFNRLAVDLPARVRGGWFQN